MRSPRKCTTWALQPEVMTMSRKRRLPADIQESIEYPLPKRQALSPSSETDTETRSSADHTTSPSDVSQTLWVGIKHWFYFFQENVVCPTSPFVALVCWFSTNQLLNYHPKGSLPISRSNGTNVYLSITRGSNSNRVSREATKAISLISRKTHFLIPYKPPCKVVHLAVLRDITPTEFVPIPMLTVTERGHIRPTAQRGHTKNIQNKV